MHLTHQTSRVVQVDGKYVMLEMLLGAAPFGDVKHTDDTILCTRKLANMSHTLLLEARKEIVIVDSVFVCAHEGHGQCFEHQS